MLYQKINCCCVKIIRNRSFSGPYFPAVAMNKERYSVSLYIKSECRKIPNRKTPNANIFHVVRKAQKSQNTGYRPHVNRNHTRTHVQEVLRSPRCCQYNHPNLLNVVIRILLIKVFNYTRLVDNIITFNILQGYFKILHR